MMITNDMILHAKNEILKNNYMNALRRFGAMEPLENLYAFLYGNSLITNHAASIVKVTNITD